MHMCFQKCCYIDTISGKAHAVRGKLTLKCIMSSCEVRTMLGWDFRGRFYNRVLMCVLK